MIRMSNNIEIIDATQANLNPAREVIKEEEKRGDGGS